MELDERTRHGLFQRLDDVIGPQYAEALMSYLPPVGWADVATKRDLDALESKLTHRFETMLHREIGSVRGEIGSVRGEIGSVRGEIGSVRGEIGSVHGEIGSVRAEIGELHSDVVRQTRALFLALAGLMVTLTAITIAAITAS